MAFIGQDISRVNGEATATIYRGTLVIPSTTSGKENTEVLRCPLAIATANCLGIAQEDAAPGETLSIRVIGVSRAKLYDTVACGAMLMCAASGETGHNGELKTATGATAVLQAKALQKGVSGDYIDVLVGPSTVL